MECVFVCHSYIRRLRDVFVTVMLVHVERVADDIVFIRELEHTRRTIATVKPAVVVIDIGTNDIAHLTADDHVAILNLVTRVYEFAHSLRVVGGCQCSNSPL